VAAYLDGGTTGSPG